MRSVNPHLASLVYASVVLASIPYSGVASAQSKEEARALQEQRAIQATLIGFADKYMSSIAQASDDVRAAMPDNLDVRVLAQGYKLHSARAALDIATGPNPEAALLDMLVFSSLQRIAMDAPWSTEAFGRHRRVLLDATSALEREIWDAAARYMSPEDLAELREHIAAWRARNPDMRYVFYVRFDDFAAARLDSPLADKARKGGLLVDVSDVSRSADQAILLAERALHTSNRLPTLLSWEIESLYFRLVTSPEARSALEQSGRMSTSLARFATSLEKLPKQISAERSATIAQLAKEIAIERAAALRDVGALLATERGAAIADLQGLLRAERQAILTELDARREALAQAAGVIQTSLVDADELAVHLGETSATIKEVIESADKLVGRFEGGPDASREPSEPFNLASYVEAIRELTLAIQEANTLVLSAERIVGAEAPVTGIFDRVLWVGTLLIFILCITAFFTMLIYRAAVRRIFVDARG